MKIKFNLVKFDKLLIYQTLHVDPNLEGRIFISYKDESNGIITTTASVDLPVVYNFYFFGNTQLGNNALFTGGYNNSDKHSMINCIDNNQRDLIYDLIIEGMKSISQSLS